MKELITIIFYGVISHVDLSPVAMNTAVMPYVDDHRPVMCISTADAVTIPDSPAIAKPSSSNKYCKAQYEVDLREIKASFDGIDESEVRYTKAFLRAVPSLTELSKFKCSVLNPAVVRRTPDKDLFPAFVDYRGGELDVEEYFPMRGEVEGHGQGSFSEPRCFACKVALRMAAKSDTVTIALSKSGVAEPIRIKVRGSSTILVMNAAATTPQGNLTSHFKHHYSIFQNKACSAFALTPSQQKCDLPVCQESVPTSGAGGDPDVDCSNSHFP